MPERRSFVLPPGSLWPRWWLIASVAAHFVVFTAVVRSSMQRRFAGDRAATFLLAAAPPPGTPVKRLTWPGGGPAGRPGRRSRAAGVPLGTITTPDLPPDTARLAVRAGAGGRDTATTSTTGSRWGADLVGTGAYALQPQLGNGALWVRPLIEMTFSDRPIRLDSAIAMRMRIMADSVDKHPPADPNADPYVSRPWTFRAGGKTYGLDSKGLHLGNFTIPTMLLAFLSMPQGNIDQARANRALMQMRGDILRAAARAQTEDDFRKAVRDLRARKERERKDQQQQQPPPQPAQP